MARPLEDIESWLSRRVGEEHELKEAYRAVVEEVAREGCRLRQAPYPCDELPGYSKALWCASCKARAVLEETNGA